MITDDLLLISIGGGAAMIARRIVERSSTPMRALILDTDDAVLSKLTPTTGVSTTIFGTDRFHGRGTGGDRNLASSALRDDISQIMTQIGTPRLVLIITCIGGGTSGALQELLEGLKGRGIATLTFATLPFSFEGDDRKRNCVLLDPISDRTDALATIPLDSLLTPEQSKLSIDDAFAVVADRLSAGLHLIWTLLAYPSYLSFDAEGMIRMLTERTNLQECHFAFADATATGENRAQEVVQQIVDSKRFNTVGVRGLGTATQIVVGVLAGKDLRLYELGTIMNGIRDVCKAAQNISLGTAEESSREGALTVVVLAFGERTQIEEHPAEVPGAQGRTTRRRSAPKAAVLLTGKSRFDDVEATLVGGQNLDEPTYKRRNIRLAR